MPLVSNGLDSFAVVSSSSKPTPASLRAFLLAAEADPDACPQLLEATRAAVSAMVPRLELYFRLDAHGLGNFDPIHMRDKSVHDVRSQNELEGLLAQMKQRVEEVRSPEWQKNFVECTEAINSSGSTAQTRSSTWPGDPSSVRVSRVLYLRDEELQALFVLASRTNGRGAVGFAIESCIELVPSDRETAPAQWRVEIVGLDSGHRTFSRPDDSVVSLLAEAPIAEQIMRSYKPAPDHHSEPITTVTAEHLTVNQRLQAFLTLSLELDILFDPNLLFSESGIPGVTLLCNCSGDFFNSLAVVSQELDRSYGAVELLGWARWPGGFQVNPIASLRAATKELRLASNQGRTAFAEIKVPRDLLDAPNETIAQLIRGASIHSSRKISRLISRFSEDLKMVQEGRMKLDAPLSTLERQQEMETLTERLQALRSVHKYLEDLEQEIPVESLMRSWPLAVHLLNQGFAVPPVPWFAPPQNPMHSASPASFALTSSNEQLFVPERRIKSVLSRSAVVGDGVQDFLVLVFQPSTNALSVKGAPLTRSEMFPPFSPPLVPPPMMAHLNRHLPTPPAAEPPGGNAAAA